MVSSRLRNPKVLVVGAGPAGLCGAIAVAETCGSGEDVLIVDEGIEPGGQLPKQTHKFFGHEGFYASTRGYEIGEKLVKRAKDLGVRFMLQSTVAGIYEDSVVVYDRVENKTLQMNPEYLLLATGASEKFLAFKNNTLPGIYGAGAVQTLMNQYKVLPGRSFLIVGAGNIGLIVAYQLLQAGADVKAIVEASSKVGGYIVHANKIKRMGVPILLNHTIVAALGTERVEGAVIAQVDANLQPLSGTERELVVDTICLAVGLQPTVELASQAGAKLAYIPELGGYVPLRDEDMRTTVPNVYVAGDLAGIEEATTAMIEGYIAGYNIAQRLTGIDLTEKISKMKQELIEFRRGPFSDKVRIGLSKMGLTFPAGGYRTEIQEDNGPVGKLRAVIECPQAIPCNPCETSCPSGAISVGGNINGIPHVDYSKCTGCGVCVMKCPGLAIFMIQEREDYSLVGIPYEMLPIPEKGTRVQLLNREGAHVADGEVEGVVINRREKTHIVYLRVPKGYESEVRYFRITKKEDVYVCRCEEITVEDVEAVIDSGITDYEELRRILRIGMGPCGGRTCRSVVLQILSKKTGLPIAEQELGAHRPPVVPLPFEAIINSQDLREETLEPSRRGEE
ncbi:FAD-dependent oxidoreductase [Fervidobacterium thailandense]|uniref:(2Fe-2S)-binding protein n=1 Tax=Fervidobacterium thailandense TaxID=1008305 RepID=A0A1E3G3F0_9BACT|nr:FAD-dependent oxidoreductase [Fervidobacterium thailandense]ODN30208.1 (2Fe-2S)-binding protein [Fervidobacterium thailandense]